MRRLLYRSNVLSLLCGCWLALAPGALAAGNVEKPDEPFPSDPREAYDVIAYRLDLSIDPDQKRLNGKVAIEARCEVKSLSEIVVDLTSDMQVDSVSLLERDLRGTGSLAGPPLRFEHEGDRLTCTLDSPAAKFDTLRIVIGYSGSPRARDRFTGFHWKTTAEGEPWIGTSYQLIGAHHWFPCKASFFHPEDKPARIFVNLDVPDDLVAVSNGRLAQRSSEGDREIFRWFHGYPIPTYSITLNIAPYVVTETPLGLVGLLDPVPFNTFVLPENEEKAKLQFREVRQMLKIFSEVFGPYPFPQSKFALVETSFWGMEHSTAVAYGSSYPAWCEANDESDPYASRNRFFDYILVHESAHEWWGNAVSSKDWGDFWIQEGFATYAEGVYVERTKGRSEADRFFESQRRSIGKRSRVYSGKDLESAREGYSPSIYTKGAWVLNTLRHYVDNDQLWWATIRTFYENYRYGSASTRDFLRTLNRTTGEDWNRFFDEWIYGVGYPNLSGSVAAKGNEVRLKIDNEGSAKTGFHVPLDLEWYEGERQIRKRIWLDPGSNDLTLKREMEVSGLSIRNLHRVLGTHEVDVR